MDLVTPRILFVLVAALVLPGTAAARETAPGPVSVSVSDDVSASLVAFSLLGDARGGLVGGSAMGDVTSDGVAVSLMGDATGGLALSVHGSYCSTWLDSTLTCDGNGLANTSEHDLPIARRRVEEPWPLVVSADGCDPSLTLRVALPVLVAECGSGCARRVFVVVAALTESSVCDGEACERSIGVNAAMGGKSHVCSAGLQSWRQLEWTAP